MAYSLAYPGCRHFLLPGHRIKKGRRCLPSVLSLEPVGMVVLLYGRTSPAELDGEAVTACSDVPASVAHASLDEGLVGVAEVGVGD